MEDLVEEINNPINRVDAFDSFRIEFNRQRIVIEGSIGREVAGEYRAVEHTTLVVEPAQFALALGYIFPSNLSVGITDVKAECRRRIQNMLLWRVEQIKNLPHGTLQTDIMADF